jgi:hypothetical protein
VRSEEFPARRGHPKARYGLYGLYTSFSQAIGPKSKSQQKGTSNADIDTGALAANRVVISAFINTKGASGIR